MRKLLMVGAALAMMLVAGAPALAQSAAQEQYGPGDERSKTFEGYVISTGGGDVVVSQDPSLGVDDPGYCDKTIDFKVARDTRVLISEGGNTAPASTDDISVGQEVRVDYTEDPDAVYPAICPPQREADAVILLSDPGDENPPDDGNPPQNPPNENPPNENPPNGGNGDSGSGGGSGSGASLPGSAYTVLPDTGGASLAVLAAGAALLVAGGLLAVERATRR